MNRVDFTNDNLSAPRSDSASKNSRRRGTASSAIIAASGLVLGLLLAAPSASRADDAPAAADAAQVTAAQADSVGADAVQDLLFCTPQKPLLIRLHLFVNGNGFLNLRKKWADTQFAAFDADQNGFLEGDEIKRLPDPATLRPGMAADLAKLPPADSNPADGKVSPEECRRFLLMATGTPFLIQSIDNQQRIVFADGNQGPQVNLFPKIDTDQDGKLSKKEIEAAAANLRRYDRNEDDVVDNAELQQGLPDDQASTRQQLAGVVSLLFIVDPSDGGVLISRRLIESYDKASRDPVAKLFRKDEKLTQSELQIDPASFARADLNKDGKLDRKELGSLSQAMTPTIELEIHAPSTDGKYLVKSRRPVDPAVAPLIDVLQTASGSWVLSLNDTELVLNAAGPPVNADTQLRELYYTQFKNMDGDNNDYLQLDEVRRYGFQESFFQAADSDKDGKVFEKEYKSQVDLEIALSQSSFTLEVTSDGHSLFRLIDAMPADGRLSLRELSDAAEKLIQVDSNGDGAISLSELSIRLDAAFKAGTPRVNGPFGQQLGQGMANANPAPVADANAPPTWFTKMDRNKDGDLSPKEFLARRALFDKIDKNRDGLISADEARTANVELAPNAQNPVRAD